MWLTFLFKMLTWYPYYIIFGFLKRDIEEYNISQVNKAYKVIGKPLVFASWIVVGVHGIILAFLTAFGGGIWALFS